MTCEKVFGSTAISTSSKISDEQFLNQNYYFSSTVICNILCCEKTLKHACSQFSW